MQDGPVNVKRTHHSLAAAYTADLGHSKTMTKGPLYPALSSHSRFPNTSLHTRMSRYKKKM